MKSISIRQTQLLIDGAKCEWNFKVVLHLRDAETLSAFHLLHVRFVRITREHAKNREYGYTLADCQPCPFKTHFKLRHPQEFCLVLKKSLSSNASISSQRLLIQVLLACSALLCQLRRNLCRFELSFTDV